LNGVDSLAVMKLDILDGLKEIKICTGYKLNGKTSHSFPATIDALEKGIPVYESHPGWMSSTQNVHHYKDLPSQAKAYLRRIEELLNLPISIISVGPERDRTIWMDRFFE
jgi:adenylosuccinate synthase